MKTLVTADLHLSDNPRDAYRLRFFESGLPKLLAEHEAERLVVLGDLTETKDGHRAGLVNAVVDGTAALAKTAHVYYLKANHDYVREDTPFFRFTKHLPRVRWINDPTPLELKGLGSCLFLPHTRSPEDWVDFMFDSYDYFFCHQTFNGADMGGRKAAGGGFDPHIFSGKKFRALSGDVHVPQRVGSVEYVGAPYAVNFGDDFAPRVLLLDGHKMTSIPVVGPQKRLIEASSIAGLMGAEKGLQPGDIVKVRATMEPGGYSRAEGRKRIREWAAEVGVVLAETQIVAPEERRPTRAEREKHRTSDADLVRAYAKRKGAGGAAVAAGLKIVEEVR